MVCAKIKAEEEFNIGGLLKVVAGWGDYYMVEEGDCGREQRKAQS